MDAILTAILAHSRNLGARWAHKQAIEAARMAILAEVPAIEAALPAAVPTLPRQPGEHWEAGLVRRNNAEHARTAPVRALQDAASEVERQCHPGHYTSAETLTVAGLPPEVVSRVVAAVAAAPTYAAQPAWQEAPDVPAGTIEAFEALVDAPGADIRDRFTPAPGWGLRFLSGAPHSAAYTARITFQGTRVAEWERPAGRLRIMAWDEEQARDKADKAARKANHDTYQAQLASVRAALDNDPALRGTLAACYEGSDLARVCLALDGWDTREGQEGGTITPPWGGVPVGVRGALRLPREGGR